MGAHYPSLLRTAPNIYQHGDAFYDCCVHINLREITHKRLVDVWLTVFNDSLTLLLLVENPVAVVEDGRFKVGEVTKEFLKIGLSRQKIQTILRKKELVSDPEPTIFGNRFFYHFLMSRCTRMFVFNDSNPVFVFPTTHGVAFLSSHFTKYFTFSNQESLQLAPSIGSGSAITMPGSRSRLQDFRVHTSAGFAFFSVNQFTLALSTAEQASSIYFCDQTSRILDIDSDAKVVLFPETFQGLQVAPLDLAPIVEADSSNIHVFRLAILNPERPTEEAVVSAPTASLLHWSPQSTVLALGKEVLVRANQPPKTEASFFNTKFEFDAIFPASVTNPIGKFDLFGVNRSSEFFLMGISDESLRKVFELPAQAAGEKVLHLMDGFLSDEWALVVTTAHVIVYNQPGATLVALLPLPQLLKVRNCRVHKHLVLLALEGAQGFGVVEMGQGELRWLQLPEEVTDAIAFDLLEDQIFMVNRSGQLRGGDLEKILAAPDFFVHFEMTDFENAIFDAYVEPDPERNRKTFSVTSLPITIPKIGKGIPSSVADMRVFAFRGKTYFLFWTDEGFVYLYHFVESIVVRVYLETPLTSTPGGTLDIAIFDDRVLIRAGRWAIFCLSFLNGREEVISVYQKECRHWVALADSRLVVLGALGLVKLSPGIVRERASPLAIEGDIIRVIPLKETSQAFGDPSDDLRLVHSKGNVERISVVNREGKVLAVQSLQADQTVTCIRNISSVYPEVPIAIFLGIMTTPSNTQERRARWQVLGLVPARDNSPTMGITLLADQTAQESHRSVSACFAFGKLLFVCLDDKMLRIEQNKVKSIVDLNLGSVSLAVQSQNLLVLGDRIGVLSAFFWNPEKAELAEHASVFLGKRIRDVAFLEHKTQVS